MKKILFIGSYAGRYNITGGEIAKSRILLKYFSEAYSVKSIDLYWERKNIFQYIIYRTIYEGIKLLKLLWYGMSSEKIVICKTNAKFVKWLHRINCSRKVILFGIGGKVPETLIAQIPDASFWNAIQGIYVESKDMVKRFHDYGVNNAVYLPNAKCIPQYADICFESEGILKLFYVGKVCEEKGCLDLVSAVNKLNRDTCICKLWIYGAYKKNFPLNEYLNDNICYGGQLDLIDSTDDYDRLRKFDVFVFPTKWEYEGFPGVLIDAMALGKPIIASRHNYNEDIIEENEFGLFFEKGNIDELCNCILKYSNNREMIYQHGRRALEEAEKYDVKKVLRSVMW